MPVRNFPRLHDSNCERTAVCLCLSRRVNSSSVGKGKEERTPIVKVATPAHLIVQYQVFGQPTRVLYPEVLAKFGLSVEDGSNLEARLRHLSGFIPDYPLISPYVPNLAFKHMSSNLDTDTTSHYALCCARQSEGRICALPSLLLKCLPGEPDFGDGQLIRDYSDRLQRQHLLRSGVIGIAPFPQHFVAYFICHMHKTIFMMDPLGKGYVQCVRLARSINKWLHTERSFYNFSPAADYISVAVDDLPLQGDAISCGPFACHYLFYVCFKNRFPTSADFNQLHHKILRQSVAHTCLTGRINVVPDDLSGNAAMEAELV